MTARRIEGRAAHIPNRARIIGTYIEEGEGEKVYMYVVIFQCGLLGIRPRMHMASHSVFSECRPLGFAMHEGESLPWRPFRCTAAGCQEVFHLTRSSSCLRCNSSGL